MDVPGQGVLLQELIHRLFKGIIGDNPWVISGNHSVPSLQNTIIGALNILSPPAGILQLQISGSIFLSGFIVQPYDLVDLTDKGAFGILDSYFRIIDFH